MQAQRLQDGSRFYEPIKKLNLHTFSVLWKDTVIKGTNKEIILKSDNWAFRHMLLLARHRKLDMQEVFYYPLGPKPWALANEMEHLTKHAKQC